MPQALMLAFLGLMGVGILVLGSLLRRARIAQQSSADLATTRAERLDAIINTSVDGIIVIDSRGLIEEFNPAAERLFGYTRTEIVGKPVYELMPAPYREQHDNFLDKYLQTGTAKIIGIGRETHGRRKDGTTFPLHLAVGETRIGGDRKFTGIVHDLTARIAMEEQLREQNAMTRLGEMSTVIAHEVKNPLAGIRGAIEVISTRLPPDSGDAGIAHEIISRVDDLNEMLQGLLFFARPPRLKVAPMSIVSVVEAAAIEVKRDAALFGTAVTISGNTPQFAADRELLRIAFQHLLTNSAQAMKGSGAITVNVATNQAECTITVADNGPGIGPDIIEKILTPFFTTKARGPGLGLPIARRIVEAHRGTLTIAPPSSQGATIVVRVPMDLQG